MGIRFLCPACNKKLNVKSFLAGKKGRCPKCNARIVIPEQSEWDDPRDQDSDDAPEAFPAVDVAVAAQPQAPSPTGHDAGEDSNGQHSPGPAAPVTAASTAAERPAAAPSASPAGSSPAAVPAAAPPAGTAAPQAPAAPAGPDPLREDPAAMWYLRHPTGNQYGPTRAEDFRRWIDQRRVTQDCMVWRTGWPQWRRAGDVFGDMLRGGAPPAASPAMAAPAMGGPTVAAPTIAAPTIAAPTVAAPTVAAPTVAAPAVAATATMAPGMPTVAAPVAAGVPIVAAEEPNFVRGAPRPYRRSNAGRVVAMASLVALIVVLLPILVWVLLYRT